MAVEGFFVDEDRADEGRWLEDVAGSTTESGASEAAAAERVRFAEGVDDRGAGEDDVDRAGFADPPVEVVFGALLAAGFRPAEVVGTAPPGASVVVPSDGTPSVDAGVAVCSEGTDGVAPSSF